MVPAAFKEALRLIYRRTLINAGEYTVERAEASLRNGWVDLIGFGRSFVANLDLPTAFAIGVVEFVVAGVLPAMADDLGVPLVRAGGLVGLYALAVGTALVVLTLVRLPRKPVLFTLVPDVVVLLITRT